MTVALRNPPPAQARLAAPHPDRTGERGSAAELPTEASVVDEGMFVDSSVAVGRAALAPLLEKLERKEPLTLGENTAFLRAYKSLDARERRGAFLDLQRAVSGMDGRAPKQLLRAWQKAKFQHVPELLLGMKTEGAYAHVDRAEWEIFMMLAKDGLAPEARRQLKRTHRELQALRAELQRWPHSRPLDDMTLRFEGQVQLAQAGSGGLVVGGVHLTRKSAETGHRKLDTYSGAGGRLFGTGLNIVRDHESGRVAVESIVRFTPKVTIAWQRGALYPGGGLKPGQVNRLRVGADLSMLGTGVDGYVVPPGFASDGTSIVRAGVKIFGLELAGEVAVNDPRLEALGRWSWRKLPERLVNALARRAM